MNQSESPLPSDADPRRATAFRITINGAPYCEADDLTTVTMVVDELRHRAEQRITLYASGHGGHLQWMTANLAAGDRIVIEIVEAVAERESQVQHCDFCGREVHDVHTLVQATEGNICDRCIGAFSTAVHKGTALPVGASFRDDSSAPCRFCGKAPPEISGVVMRKDAAICAECLRTGADLLSERPSRSGLNDSES